MFAFPVSKAAVGVSCQTDTLSSLDFYDNVVQIKASLVLFCIFCVIYKSFQLFLYDLFDTLPISDDKDRVLLACLCARKLCQ